MDKCNYMKTKVLSFVISLAVLPFASCSDEAQELVEEQSQPLNQIVMTMQDFQPEAASRTLYEVNEAVECTWAANDTVGIFPDKGAQAYFPMASGAGTKNAAFDGEGWALKDGRTYGAYYPFIGTFYLDRHAVPVSYAGQTQVGNATTTHLGAYDFMVAAPATSVSGAAQFTFKHLSALAQLKLTVPEPTTFNSVKLVADTEAFALKGEVDIMADSAFITPVTTSKEITVDLQDVATTEENQTVTFYLMVPPVDLSGQNLKAVIVSDKGTQEVALAGKNFKPGKAYSLSGEFENIDLGYKDGVVRIGEAGTMQQLLGDGYLDITSLKVVGPINGDDVRCLRQMLGDFELDDEERGKLATLDLSDATIVEGGGRYYETEYYQYRTSNDVIGDFMFSQCTNLQRMVLPDGVTSIGAYAFSGCSSLTSIDIPVGVTSIDNGAFYECYDLTSISIPAGVTSIGEYAFYFCNSLTSIHIPDGVISIGKSAFENCSLDSVHVADLSVWFKIAFNGYYSNPLCNGAKLYVDNQELTELVVPEDITEIKAYAFSKYYHLTSVTIGAGVTSIGGYSFYGCSSLSSVTMGTGVVSIGAYAFNGCSSVESVYIKDLSAWCKIAFQGQYSTPFNYGVKLYLNSEELTELVIPEDITEIKAYAFYYCASIKKVTIGKNVTSIGTKSFGMCHSLTQVYCYATTPPAIETSSNFTSFTGEANSRTLYVPKGCIEAYQASDWKDFFGTIVEME